MVQMMEVVEGTTRLEVPATEHRLGPKAREGAPFYNPAMRVARDVSVLLLKSLALSDKRPWRICDAMAATGARGLRLANEVPGTKVQLNDANPASIQLAQQNAKRLGLRNVDFRVGRLESHLAAEEYDWVDLDPFGTPAPFIDVAMLSVTEGGVVAVTATDRATLSGVYPDACLRRYNAKPHRGPCMPELAARILLGAVVRAAGRRDRGATPLLAYCTEHFARVYVRVHGGPREGDEAAARMGYAVFRKDGTHGVAPQPEPGAGWAGPLWTGPLSDPSLVAAMAQAAAKDETVGAPAKRLVQRLSEEAGAPPLYYTVDDLTRRQQLNAPRIERVIESARSAGHVAVRTHFSPRGIKTDAGPYQLRQWLNPVKDASAGTPSR